MIASDLESGEIDRSHVLIAFQTFMQLDYYLHRDEDNITHILKFLAKKTFTSEDLAAAGILQEGMEEQMSLKTLTDNLWYCFQILQKKRAKFSSSLAKIHTALCDTFDAKEHEFKSRCVEMDGTVDGALGELYQTLNNYQLLHNREARYWDPVQTQCATDQKFVSVIDSCGGKHVFSSYQKYRTERKQMIDNNLGKFAEFFPKNKAYRLMPKRTLSSQDSREISWSANFPPNEESPLVVKRIPNSNQNSLEISWCSKCVFLLCCCFRSHRYSSIQERDKV